ncbi:MAG: L,D-transpeptidase family protein [Akkermansiaceae bacterium]
MPRLRLIVLWIFGAFSLFFLSCGSKYDSRNQMIVSVRDQKMLLVKDDKPIKAYPISTSKFGLGSRAGSCRTPLGRLEVAKKVGGGAPSGAVFKSRRRTGEILRPNAPGRDPIVTRILWLRGLEHSNRNTMARCIYIHGTPEERTIGRPTSYGCIRMKSRHIIDLYKRVGVGAGVRVIRESLDTTSAGRTYYARRGTLLRATATRW